MGAGLGLWSSGRAAREASWRPGTGRSGFVYVIEGEHGYLKVGHSVSPPGRLGSLQTGSPFRLRILHTLYIHSDAAAVEASARATLDRWKVLNEWFDISPDVAIAAVYGAAVRFGDVGSGVRHDAPLEMRSWVRRTAWVCVAFTPGWTAMSLHAPEVAIVFLFLGLVAISAGLQRSQRKLGEGLRTGIGWLGSITAGMAASILCGLVFGSARAAERPAFPLYDSEAYCSKVVALLNDNQILKEGCLSNESDAKSKLQRVWSQPPVEVEVQCIKMMGLGSPNNYQAMGGCVAIGVGNSWMNGTVNISR